MSDNKCENCENEIRIQIRKNTGSCSLACDRAMGIGKYASRKADVAADIYAASGEFKAKSQQTIIVNNVLPTVTLSEAEKARIYRQSQCTCGHPGLGCYCR